MSRSKSSRRWLDEHHSDSYVKKSKAQSYRSRAVYKLEEIDVRDRLIQPHHCIIELGAAPGGWTQYIAQKMSSKGFLLAVDVLPMDPIDGAHVIEADFTEDETLQLMRDVLDGRQADLVLSDMAPNFTGQPAVDQPRSMYLVELALDMCGEFLRDGGSLLVKTFQGAGFEELNRELRSAFDVVKTRKPSASRQRSREVYLLAKGRRAR